jgi:hypothetical protein
VTQGPLSKATSRQAGRLPLPPPSSRALGLVPATVTALAAFLFLPRIQSSTALVWSFAAAIGVLLAWLVVLGRHAGARSFRIEVSLRPQHYVQALAPTAILVYWGIYWPPMRDAAALIAAQVVFAYAFDMLLAWSRRDTYSLGFGPVLIVLTTNLFLRFQDDWFYLQFLMVAVGFLAKELIRWEKDGVRVHIFNPSAFSLALFSLGLIVTGTTGITWGEDIASLLILPPQIYLFIFLVSLPALFLFRVTTMTLPAVLTTYLFSVAYLRATGTYFYFDADIPVAVFLGMHLLFTDPSTSPRTELGRICFGVLYGASVVGLYALLGAMGAPTFYDKLLAVPLMNVMVKAIDRAAHSARLAWLDPGRLGAGLAPRMRSLAYVSIWVAVFGVMTAADGVGDHHPGHSVRFWQDACRDQRRNACRDLAALISQPCRVGSGWACNELGVLVATGRVDAAPAEDLFELACEVGSSAGCGNGTVLAGGGTEFSHGDPRLGDYALLLQEGKGPLRERTPVEVFARACDEGWAAGCGDLARLYFQGDTVDLDQPRAADLLEAACSGGHAVSCSNLGLMYSRGDGVLPDEDAAAAYLRKACELGSARACELAEQEL